MCGQTSSFLYAESITDVDSESRARRLITASKDYSLDWNLLDA